MVWVFPGRRSLAAGRWGLWGLHTEMCLWGRAGRVQSVRACAHMVCAMCMSCVSRGSRATPLGAPYIRLRFFLFSALNLFFYSLTHARTKSLIRRAVHCSSVSRQSAERKDKRYKRISFVPKYRLSSTFSYGNQKTAPPRPRWRGLQYEARRLGACSRLAASGKSSQAKATRVPRTPLAPRGQCRRTQRAWAARRRTPCGGGTSRREATPRATRRAEASR